MKTPSIKKRITEICKQFDKRVKEDGAATAGFELSVELAGAYQRIAMMQDYLDQCVSFWQQQEKDGSKVAEYYIDAFQSAKTSASTIFEESSVVTELPTVINERQGKP